MPSPKQTDKTVAQEETESVRDLDKPQETAAMPQNEQGGPRGLEPTRFGDWERKGRCIDF